MKTLADRDTVTEAHGAAVHAPVKTVWPWLVQMGQGHTGDLDRIEPAYQRPRPGARLLLLLWSATASVLEYGVLHGIKRRAGAAASGRAPDQAVDNRCSLCPDGWIRTIDLGSRHVVHLHDWCDGCGWRLCTRSQGQCTWQDYGR